MKNKSSQPNPPKKSRSKPLRKESWRSKHPVNRSFGYLLQTLIEQNLGQQRIDYWNECRDKVSFIVQQMRSDQKIATDEGIETQLKWLQTFFAPEKDHWILESLWVFPGHNVLDELNQLLTSQNYTLLEKKLRTVVELLSTHGDQGLRIYTELNAQQDNLGIVLEKSKKLKKHFTVLIVDDMPSEMRIQLIENLKQMERSVDQFVYDMIFVDNVEDAVFATLLNQNIQACVIRQDLPVQGSIQPAIRLQSFDDAFIDDLKDYLKQDRVENAPHPSVNMQRGIEFGNLLKELLPRMNVYLVLDTAVHLSENISDSDTSQFDRIFYRYDNITEIHMTLLDGVRKKYRTPFFDSLQQYASRPVGNFHALPIARGHSVFNSPWLQDMREFYGDNIFLAETSATTGGLDSLLDPKGSLKEAQEAAARSFGAHQSFFVTNGTSTANKIVVQALVKPGDIVLIDRNCHKSHHYGIILAGAKPLYLDAFWNKEYAIYGAVRLTTESKPKRGIIDTLKELKRKGLLEKVRMLLLTNCTFDGMVYDPKKVMEEVLKIKPDIYFLWDEAWFGFGRFFPCTKRRTAMHAAQKLEHSLENGIDLHVYATQSTHKSLSCLRQGSMIHVFDKKFNKIKDSFHEAFFTHTSTSPNYQILASLDLARRQVDLEGFKVVNSAYQKAQTIRHKIENDPEISAYFQVLNAKDLIPQTGLQNGPARKSDPRGHTGGATLPEAQAAPEFILDPTRITLCTTRTAIGGNDFKVSELSDQCDIQVNKTSLNNVLFIITIGVTWGGVDHLLQSLGKLARKYKSRDLGLSKEEKAQLNERIEHLRQGATHEPGFSEFHPELKEKVNAGEGDMRRAFFLAYDESNKAYIHLDELLELVRKNDRTYVCASFIIPYPPGFPILVPGQVITKDILCFMQELDIKEIHGYSPSLGLPILKNFK